MDTVMKKQKTEVAGVMVALRLSHWAGKKLDKVVSKEVNDKYHTVDAGRFHKDLIANDYLKPITQKVSEIRKFHYLNTLTGLSTTAMLPTSNYLDYMTAMGEFKTDFDSLVSSFLNHYPQAVHEAHKRLQGLFKNDDYPELYDMRKKFSFQLRIIPLPENMDWASRMGIEPELDGITPMVEEAAEELWLRLSSTLSTLHERLDTPDSIVRQSLVDNLIEITKVLPKLNFTKNKALDDLANEAHRTAKSLDMISIRKSDVAKDNAAYEMEEILKKVQAYM